MTANVWGSLDLDVLGLRRRTGDARRNPTVLRQNPGSCLLLVRFFCYFPLASDIAIFLLMSSIMLYIPQRCDNEERTIPESAVASEAYQ
ncbi:hypothetical protein BO71DRAFT_70102 [Aspergillus ellipticus CBS 707.79]|uniref:Uncharacterized protein n=1 Tax=Aspergillus ellipticus CBS 707.79 TaxID=1448320 RepID=A0A319DKX1_9EURO|nr:hypothetical protein BO71DRAFT_70102 [Aspergillus ellipticus CBS 707.79]